MKDKLHAGVIQVKRHNSAHPAHEVKILTTSGWITLLPKHANIIGYGLKFKFANESFDNPAFFELSNNKLSIY